MADSLPHVTVVRPGSRVFVNAGRIEAIILNVIVGAQDFVMPMPLYQIVWWDVNGNRYVADVHECELDISGTDKVRIGFRRAP